MGGKLDAAGERAAFVLELDEAGGLGRGDALGLKPGLDLTDGGAVFHRFEDRQFEGGLEGGEGAWTEGEEGEIPEDADQGRHAGGIFGDLGRDGGLFPGDIGGFGEAEVGSEEGGEVIAIKASVVAEKGGAFDGDAEGDGLSEASRRGGESGGEADLFGGTTGGLNFGPGDHRRASGAVLERTVGEGRQIALGEETEAVEDVVAVFGIA